MISVAPVPYPLWTALLFIAWVIVTFVVSRNEAAKRPIQHPRLYWIATLVFAIAGPVFLLLRGPLGYAVSAIIFLSGLILIGVGRGDKNNES